MDFFKTAIPIFGRPETYSEMLMKLAGFVFWECVLGFSFLMKSQQFSTLIQTSPFALIPKDAIPDGIKFINPPVIIMSLIISFLFYFLQLHNLIQKPFRIRQTFDKNHIFLPLAKLVGKSPQPDKIKRFEAKRDTTMQEVFYKYASSTKSDTVVDKHDIVQALWLWSMFWALEEGVLVSIAFTITFFTLRLYSYGYSAVGIATICLVLMPALWPRLSRAARSQIEQIASDAAAKKAVRKAIDAL
ncbi:MAG: hypothetical protein K2X59_03150 [Sphingomonas sp.]|nr:hypothetical protein [Sphingomonas sp.]